MSDDKDEINAIADITNRSITNFVRGQLLTDFEMLSNMFPDSSPSKIVLVQHATLINTMARNMFSFLATVDDEFPKDVMKGLCMSVVEAGVNGFRKAKKEQEEET